MAKKISSAPVKEVKSRSLYRFPRGLRDLFERAVAKTKAMGEAGTKRQFLADAAEDFEPGLVVALQKMGFCYTGKVTRASLPMADSTKKIVDRIHATTGVEKQTIIFLLIHMKAAAAGVHPVKKAKKQRRKVAA